MSKQKKEYRFSLGLGGANPILPGNVWKSYYPELTEESIIFLEAKQGTGAYEVKLSDIERAEFGKNNGLLWLQLWIRDRGFVALTTRGKEWQTDAAKAMIDAINSQTPVIDMKYFDHIRKSSLKFFFFG